MTSEHRREARQRVFLKGRIYFNNGASSLDCLVRDMSSSGARLIATETATLPERFDLFIPQKDRTYRATLRWRHKEGVGVTFGDETPSAAAPVAEETPTAFLLRRVSELEAENAALKRMLAEMVKPAPPAGTA